MNFKSDDSTEIGYIIPDNIQWGLGQIDEMPTTIFDKDLIIINNSFQLELECVSENAANEVYVSKIMPLKTCASYY
jgi:hypothetical protein